MHRKHIPEMKRALARGDYEQTDGGILVKGGVMARGVYTARVDGEIVGRYHNLVPMEGLNYFLGVGMAGDAAATGFYMALFSGAVSPASNWTAANFAANATEITSSTEGYSNATRPQWIPGAPASGVIDNAGNLATYNIVCTTSINIAGAAILTDSAKGGTAGKLISASRFDNVHTVNNGSTFELGYELELADV